MTVRTGPGVVSEMEQKHKMAHGKQLCSLLYEHRILLFRELCIRLANLDVEIGSIGRRAATMSTFMETIEDKYSLSIKVWFPIQRKQVCVASIIINQIVRCCFIARIDEVMHCPCALRVLHRVEAKQPSMFSTESQKQSRRSLSMASNELVARGVGLSMCIFGIPGNVATERVHWIKVPANEVVQLSGV